MDKEKKNDNVKKENDVNENIIFEHKNVKFEKYIK